MADREMQVQKVALHCPPLEEAAKVLQDGLSKNFADVQVSVVDCPDLTQKPFMLADKGICGSPRIADIGGVPYLMPFAQGDRIYDLARVAKQCELPEALVIGAGAGPYHKLGHNSEMITNIKLGGEVANNSHIVRHTPENDSFKMFKSDIPECVVLMNVLMCEGKGGKVLEVKADKRTGELCLYTCMRKALNDHYGTKPVGLGGAFLLKTGRAKIHVMPNFSKVPLTSDDDVDNWLKYYDMPAELVSLGVLTSHDPDLDLRIEHFHCFSDHGHGGHYHYDTTPDIASYLGYFNIAEYMFRVDRPAITHDYGRD